MGLLLDFGIVFALNSLFFSQVGNQASGGTHEKDARKGLNNKQMIPQVTSGDTFQDKLET